MASVTHGPEGLMAVLTAGVIAIGPDLGHYALMVFGAWIGCMHSIAKKDFQGSKKAAFNYMALWIATACLLTGGTSAAIVTYIGFPADRWPGVVAFAITFLADKWPTWLEGLVPQSVKDAFSKQQ